MDDLEAITDLTAGEPLKAENDQGKAEQHPLPDLIAYEQHRAGTRATKNKTSGAQILRVGRFVPPGAV